MPDHATRRRTRRLLAAVVASVLALSGTGLHAADSGSDSGVGAGFRAITAASSPALVDHDGDGVIARVVDLGAIDRTVVTLADRPEDGPPMVALDGVDEHSEYALRSRNHGTWSAWVELHAVADERPDGLPGTEGALDTGVGIGPVWIGHGADRLEIERRHGPATDLTLEVLHLVDVETEIAATDGPAFAAAGSGPMIRPRSWWATSAMSWPASCGAGPTDNGSIRGLVVHHTVNSNAYGAGDVPAMLRGIWYYHARTRGWCDIAYNFLVDRFGRIWEGRQGGVTKAIVGGHTYGFNTDTSGIAQLGDLDRAAPTAAMTAATQNLIGWKAGVHDVDPSGYAVLTNRASRTARNGTPSGGSVRVPAVSGHRDLGSTSCPGHHTHARLPSIRSAAFGGAHAFAMYEALVQRIPDGPAYLHALSVLQRRGPRAAAHDIAYSDDYAGVAIDDLYRRILGRSADAAGRAHWLAYVSRGNRLETVATRFFASAEYFDRQVRSNALYVWSLYDKILGRFGDVNGVVHWTTQLERGDMTRRQVAAHFYASLESRQKRVDRLYHDILGRGVDASGRRTWAAKLKTTDDLALAVFLVSSAEFRVRFV